MLFDQLGEVVEAGGDGEGEEEEAEEEAGVALRVLSIKELEEEKVFFDVAYEKW